jgi:hypothetical protein
MSLALLKPITITSAMFVSSTVAETDAAVWSGATTYALYDNTISTVAHRLYESQKASNTNKDPTNINNRVGSSIWWLDVSATNRWKMFDGQTTEATVGASPMTYVIKPGGINAIYFDGLDADSITVSVKDATGGTVIYSKTEVLEGSLPEDYYEWFFSPFQPIKKKLFADIPTYSNCEVTYTITKASGNISCGAVLMGDLQDIAQTLTEPTVEPGSSSYVGLDAKGNNIVKFRKSGSNLTIKAYAPTDDANRIIDVIASLGDTPCLCVGSKLSKFSGLISYGLVKASITYSSSNISYINLTLNGMTK